MHEIDLNENIFLPMVPDKHTFIMSTWDLRKIRDGRKKCLLYDCKFTG